VERHGSAGLLARQFRSPIVLLLAVSAVLSLVMGEVADSAIVLVIIVASGVLGFVQERGAVNAVDALLDSVQTHCDVVRDGRPMRLTADEVREGDSVILKTGDIVPADCRVTESRALVLNESVLTGEHQPVEKQPSPGTVSELYMGTHVESGTGTAVVTATGPATRFGELVSHVSRRHVPTSFERGVTSYGRLLARTITVLVLVVFVLNVLVDRPVAESVLFSLALAVGLTPQMLPAIITFSLSRGASAMARDGVVVKRLDSIEDIGAMDVLCTDKTGTVTVGTARVVGAVDARGGASPRVARLAAVNAALHTGYPNPVDDEILATLGPVGELPALLGEVPFDFVRRLQSVVISGKEGALLVAKGSFEQLSSRCTGVRRGEGTVPSADARNEVTGLVEQLSHRGVRVIAVGTRELVSTPRRFGEELEAGLVLEGFALLDDPVRPDASRAVADLAALGVDVRIVTGDNAFTASHVAASIGIPRGREMTGAEIEVMPDADLLGAAGSCRVFSGVTPAQKERIVRCLSAAGHTVGFVGDGINDAAALHGADVGISVKGAVDIARQTADLVIVEKDLMVIAEGIRRGRQVFANTLKYVYVTTSANFGNMVSLAVATVFLPYLPLLPLQILLLNFLSDIPAMLIAADRVDPEWTDRPRTWNVDELRLFMVTFGLVSTVLDLLTFAALRLVLRVGAVQLRTGWFLESVATELVVMLSLRTRRPAWRSRPGTALLGASVAVAAVTVLLPFAPFAGRLGLAPPSADVTWTVTAIVVLYLAANETLKVRLRRVWGA
jgi:Mg2+-importing ATPase